ncbi:NAD(P)/FAD-dependent oxidoreductase [Propioniciclava sp. MC1683]|uniref:NAD(P)/FAD-dependent oxidoreductase n=1 Tax=Propioniciclava sp. MC1683 TaxID=2760309 RepID=UPI001603A351|nr:NAD(P)/FAD-dependent oxidoreductase [Propioniciclava sp. MC1683]MBB1503140.1 NAD(P)/FAD-dependent oxidoreductase [Propioniciclava sp. MC1683]
MSHPERSRAGLVRNQQGSLKHEYQAVRIPSRSPGIDVDVRYRDTSGWYSNYRIGETTAATKILIDRSTDRIVGAHLLGPEYGELVNFFGLAMKLELTTHQLKSMTAAYPTVGSDVGSIL